MRTVPGDPSDGSPTPQEPEDSSGLNPNKVERLWRTSPQSRGFASNGYAASLWAIEETPPRRELSRPASSDTHVVSVWTSGSGLSELFLDGRVRFRRVRRRGTFQLARAGEDLRVILSERTGTCLDLYVPVLSLQRALEEEMERSAPSFELRPIKLENDPVITRVADDVAAEISCPGKLSRMAMDSAMLQLSVTLVRRWSNLSIQMRPSPGLTQLQVRKVIERMNDAIDEDLSLPELAKLAGLSTFHFARSFKRSLGVPPHQYQIGLRLARARQLLERTDLPIEEIAHRVGYDDASYFNRVFKRRNALPPGAFRQHARND